jgi:hypothetical protein
MMRVLAVLVAVLAFAPAAHADTIVFRRGGDVWRMAPDGGGQTKLTGSERRYEWPSAADDGTIAASDETGRIWRMTLDGVALGGPIPTAATFATEDAPAETPTHVRISPDAVRIAYDQVIDGDATTLWTPATASGLDFPGQENGQAFLVSPSWIGAGALLLSRDVASPEPGATFSLYAVGEGDDAAEPWFSDDGAAWATAFDAAASRDGSRVAVVADDAADNDGTPTRVVLRLFAGPAPALRCELALTPTEDVESTSPTFSPDGTRLAWAEPDGIHVATLGALTDCGSIREQVVTLPGAWEPYWTPATPATRTGSGPAPGAAPLTLAVRTRARPHRSTLRKRGLRVRVTVSAPTTVRLSVRVAGTKRLLAVTTRRLANAGTTTITLRLRRLKTAKRLVLHVAAPGAPPIDKRVRPL